jgi:hypothetical protein
MTHFKLVSILTGLSSVVLASLLARRIRADSAPASQANAHRTIGVEESPSWPPPEDMYWGM